MDGFSFPIFKTKTEGVIESFSLDDPEERKKCFEAKASEEIKKIRKFLKRNTFVGFLLGPKNSGKGTYSKLFAEAVGEKYIRHISVGDIVRDAHKALENGEEGKEIMDFLEKNYRSSIPLKDAIDAFLGRSTTTLLPTELILTLVEREITESKKKAIFIDGFPRSLDQISYSIYFRALMGYRDDPDFFAFINVPETIIDERMKNRVICPECKTPRSVKFLKTKEICYDKERDEVCLVCDDPKCKGAKYITKEGDELGIEAVRDRIEADKKVMQTLLKLEGVPKIYLRNAIPVRKAKEKIDDYEITSCYRYEVNKETGEVKTIQEPWIVKDDEGIDSYSLLPSAIVLSLMKQMVDVLEL